jgi:hypothetical protein
MAFKSSLTGLGMAPALATHSCEGDVDNTVTATGSTSQANSYAITKPFTIFTTVGANTGGRLPSFLTAGDEGVIQNNGASTLFLYPPVGGIINGGSSNAKVDVATLKGARFKCIDSLNFAVIVGA